MAACRICLKTKQNLKPISEIDGLITKIFDLANVLIIENPSEVVCKQCITDICFAFKIKAQIIKNDRYLRNNDKHIYPVSPSEAVVAKENTPLIEINSSDSETLDKKSNASAHKERKNNVSSLDSLEKPTQGFDDSDDIFNDFHSEFDENESSHIESIDSSISDLDETRNNDFYESASNDFDESSNNDFDESSNNDLDESSNNDLDESSNNDLDEFMNNESDQLDDSTVDEISGLTENEFDKSIKNSLNESDHNVSTTLTNAATLDCKEFIEILDKKVQLKPASKNNPTLKKLSTTSTSNQSMEKHLSNNEENNFEMSNPKYEDVKNEIMLCEDSCDIDDSKILKVIDIESIAEINEESLEIRELDQEEDSSPKRGYRKAKQQIFKCIKCDFATPDRRQFKSHKRRHNLIVCNVCGKMSSADNMLKHMQSHTTDPPIICNICGKSYKNKESMRSHTFMHVVKPGTCEICGQRFQYQGEYIRHKKIHREKVRKFKCSICGKSFYDNKTFLKHSQTHSGIRPYPCDICDRRLSSSHALKVHLRQHTKEKPYECSVCKIKFTQKVSMRHHMAKHH